jgi:CSLREA domain-containing protein
MRSWIQAVTGATVLAAAFAVVVVAIAAQPASALTVIDVTTTADEFDGFNDCLPGGPDCSLREAFAAAENDGDASQINLQSGARYELTCTFGGQLVHNTGNSLDLVGRGATIAQTCPGSRVISNVAQPMSIDEVTITGGNVDPATTAGGGIGTSGPLVVTRSTISGNSARSGGAINVTTSGQSLTIVNSTLTDNTTVSTGGAIRSQGTDLTLVYTTMVGNSSPTGANFSGSLTLNAFGSVIARPLGGGQNCSLNLGTTVSNGFNHDDDGSCDFGAGPSDQSDGGDPLLAALANNGGGTPTMLPEPDSPLLDVIPAGSCQSDGATGITVDQRGEPRPGFTDCDIGAVEVQPEPPEPPEPPAPPDPLVIVPTFTG